MHVYHVSLGEESIAIPRPESSVKRPDEPSYRSIGILEFEYIR